MNNILISLSYRFMSFVFISFVIIFSFNFQYKELNVNKISGNIYDIINILSEYNFKMSGLSISLLDMSIKADNVSFYIESLDTKEEIKVKNNVNIKKIKVASVKNKEFSIKNIKLKINMDKVVLSSHGKGIVLNKINSNILYNNSVVNVNSLKIKAFGGDILSSVVYDNGDIKGAISLNKIDLSKIHSSKLKINTGLLNGKSNFSLNENDLNSLSASGSIELLNSNIDNSAIAGSVVGILNGNASLGDISVKRLYSDFDINNGYAKLHKISFSSSSINATGDVNISKNKELDGELEFSGMKGLTGSSVYVRGSIDKPLILPTLGMSTGIAVGSVVAGPVGAIIGSKIGSVIEGALNNIFKRQVKEK